MWPHFEAFHLECWKEQKHAIQTQVFPPPYTYLFRHHSIGFHATTLLSICGWLAVLSFESFGFRQLNRILVLLIDIREKKNCWARDCVWRGLAQIRKDAVHSTHPFPTTESQAPMQKSLNPESLPARLIVSPGEPAQQLDCSVKRRLEIHSNELAASNMQIELILEILNKIPATLEVMWLVHKSLCTEDL